MSLAIQVWAATDSGCVRSRNEDALCIGHTVVQATEGWTGFVEFELDQGQWVAVVDGMGGHRGGAVASRLVADRLSRTPASMTGSEADISAWMNAINRDLYAEAAADPSLCGMGASMVGLWLSEGRTLCVNVGDAKAFRHQDGFLQLISEDHVLRLPDGRRSLLRSIGGTQSPEVVVPTICPERLRAGRRYLLCSDGVTDEIDLDELEHLMLLSPPAAATAMVNASREAGGRDNITLAIIEPTVRGVT